MENNEFVKHFILRYFGLMPEIKGHQKTIYYRAIKWNIQI